MTREKTDTTPTQVKLNPADRQLLDSIAAELDLTISQVVRRAIRDMAARMLPSKQNSGTVTAAVIPESVQPTPPHNTAKTSRANVNAAASPTAYKRGDTLKYNGFTWVIASVNDSGTELKLERRVGNAPLIHTNVLISDLEGD